MPTFSQQSFPSAPKPPSRVPRGISIPVGGDRSRDPVCLTFDEEMYLVEGDLYSNRTDLLHALAVKGCEIYAPEELTLYLADGKPSSAELEDYRKLPLPHIACARYVSTPHALLDLFKEVEGVARERVERVRAACVHRGEHSIRTVEEYNETARKAGGLDPMSHILILVDGIQHALINCSDGSELSSDPDYAVTTKELMAQIVRVVRLGRVAAIHTVLMADRWTVGETPLLLREYAPYCRDRILFRAERSAWEALLSDFSAEVNREELFAKLPTLSDPDCLYLRKDRPPVWMQVESMSPRERRDALERIRERYLH